MTLEEFFSANPSAAIAFSGGVDSAYLFYAALKYGRDITAYYVRSAFQPRFELEDAQALARQLGGRLRVLPVDVLCSEAVVSNPADRCYHCKRVIFENILNAAREDGYSLILDGTNASDQVSDRPGMRALREMQVQSPLRLCGLTKQEIRKLSKEAGLFTWEKPSYACLATRIPAGQRITPENLRRTEAAEAFLAGLGFRDFRVRTLGDTAKLQLRADDMAKVGAHYHEIYDTLKQTYDGVLLDLEVRHGE